MFVLRPLYLLYEAGLLCFVRDQEGNILRSGDGNIEKPALLRIEKSRIIRQDEIEDGIVYDF